MTILASLRKPVKITILTDADDGEKQSLLVKEGEDLRTNQRVMQVRSLLQYYTPKYLDLTFHSLFNL